MTHIPTFPEFDPENYKTNVQNRWVKYTARLENFFLAKKITDDARKRALVLHYVGEHTHDIYEANKSDEEPDDIKYKKAKILTTKKNELVAEHEFSACRQKETQTFDKYITEIRQLARNCSFTNTNDRMRS